MFHNLRVMRNHAAYGFALLLLVQAMTAAITVVPSEQKQEELETPFVERSSGSNNSSSPCGSNVNYTNVYAYAPYMVIENQSFTTSSYVYCEILSANMMLDYSIVNANNSTVYSGNLSWTGSNASSSNYTWNVSGLSAGYYTFHADLYVNGTFVDTSYDSFMVYANTSGGGGGGGSGNYTSPCGSNANYSYVYAYAPYMLMENQSFTTSSYVYCEILNANMMLDYSIVNANNSTVYSGNHSWTGSNVSRLNYTWNVSGLSSGYYTFHADLYINGTFVDTDYDSFMVYANTSGGGGGGGNYTSPCGNDANYSYVYAYAPYMLIENQPFSTTSYVYCEILNANMMLDFSIVDSSNSTVYSGNLSWTGTNASSSNYTWNVPGLSAGYHIFYADLYVNGAYVDTDYDPFMVYANSTGGGNNTGGNNTDGNNTGGDNTGGILETTLATTPAETTLAETTLVATTPAETTVTTTPAETTPATIPETTLAITAETTRTTTILATILATILETTPAITPETARTTAAPATTARTTAAPATTPTTARTTTTPATARTTTTTILETTPTTTPTTILATTTPMATTRCSTQMVMESTMLLTIVNLLPIQTRLIQMVMA